MITLTNTAFGYDRRQKVFSGLSLAFGEGHIHGVLGCNGIGKTTLLHLICGLLTPDAGTVSVDGIQPAGRSPRLFAKMMFIPEEIDLPDTPFHRFAAITGAFYPEYSAERFENHCGALGVDPSRSPRKMSTGQRKKAYIAFALACNTPILLLDEPTNGLDIPSKMTLRRLLAAHTDERRTILISTHQIREIEHLLDSVSILDTEGLALSATTEELSQRLLFGPLPAGSEVLYSEPSLAGREGIALNTTGAESRPDLELLFAAVTHDRTTIPALFNTNPNRHE